MMMDCSNVQDKLFGYAGGTLTASQRQEIEAHLQNCPSCSALAEAFRRLEEAIAREKSLEPPPFAATRILQRMENRFSTRRKTTAGILRPALITLAVLVALAAGYVIGQAGHSRIAVPGEAASQVETLRTDLFIDAFIDEDITLVALNQ